MSGPAMPLRLVTGETPEESDSKGLFDKIHILWQAEQRQASLWLPVFFAGGVGLYFALPAEPPGIAALAAVTLAAALWLAVRPWPVARAAALIGLMMALGLAAAVWRTAYRGTPVLPGEHGPAALSGQIVQWEMSAPRSARLTIALDSVDGLTAAQTPRRVRVTVRTGALGDWRIGDRVRLRAVLMPPPGPSHPGAHDFGRAAFFNGIGGVGFATSPVERMDGGAPDSARMRLDRFRERIADRIGTAIAGQPGAIARALLVGDKSRLTEQTKTAFRDSGLAHLLAISGLHLALVTGGVFFTLRALLALSPALALHWPIKAIAALTALSSGAGYLILSGMTLPTQRAFLMTGVVFIAMLAGRRAISLRTVALAAFLVLGLQPEALVSVSFQMSFSAVIALIAGYEAWRDRQAALGQPYAHGVMPALGRYFAAVVFSTLIAEAAINPLSIYHFNQLALYGLAGNLVAIPLTSLVIMPAGVIGLLLMPMGWEEAPLWLMGEGIAIVLAAAQQVSSAPGAVLVPPTPPFASLLLFALGGLWLCLWRTRLRLLGLAIVMLAIVPMMLARQPDILVADSGRPVAIRDPSSGALILSTKGGQRFVRDSWLRHNGQTEALRWADDPTWQTRHQLRCDAAGCALALPAGGSGSWRLALPHHAAAFEEDCRTADIMITPLPAPKGCAAPKVLIDAAALARHGGHALYLDWEGKQPPRVATVAQARGRRPWVPVQE